MITENSHLKAMLCLAGLTILLSACASLPEKEQRHSIAAEKILAVLDESVESSMDMAEKQGNADQDVSARLPRSVANALMPDMDVDLKLQTGNGLEQHFDLTVEDVTAQLFFMSLVKGSHYNMVVHPSVKGNVSISLKSVTVPQTMEIMRRVYGYEYRQTAQGYEVLANVMQSRIFHIDYLNVQRKGVSQIRVSSGQISESGNNSSAAVKGQPQQGSSSVSGSEVNTHSETDFWLELKNALSAIVTEEDGRKVVVNPQSGVVLVRAMPDELHKIEDYLEQTQSIIKRQVILEAKILEVELNDGFQSGINWAALASSGKNIATIGQTGGGTIFNGGGVSESAGNTGILDPLALSQIQGTNASAFGGIFSLALSLGDFNAFIEALEVQGDVHVLSSPRVSTVNNQKAVIKVGSDEFFVTDITTETLDSGTGIQQSINVELTPFFSGVALDVIPQINADNVVTLHVHPSVSDVKEKNKQIDISTTDTLNIPLALSSIRESDSIVSARSGQVIVIGGLMQNIVSDSRAGIPFLKDIPFIGGLFRHEKNSIKKSELVILLKPIVVENDKVWSDQLKKARKTIKGITNLYGENRFDIRAASGPQGKPDVSTQAQ